MKATISRSYTFEAAHHLPDLPDGHKCKRMHGHSYRVEFRLTGEIDDAGLVGGMEFGMIDVWFDPVHTMVDHHIWNDKIKVPTVENIAQWFLDVFDKSWGGKNLDTVVVRVYEGPRSWAEVWR